MQGRRTQNTRQERKEEINNNYNKYDTILHYMACLVLPVAKRFILAKTSRNSKFAGQLNLLNNNNNSDSKA